MTDFISVAEVAEDLGCNPQSIRSQAHADPKKLGFPVAVIGSRIYIPRRGYERWKEGNNMELYKKMLNEIKEFNSAFDATDARIWDVLIKLGIVTDAHIADGEDA